METRIEKYREEDLPAMLAIWNEVVEDGQAFPQEESLDIDAARDFFGAQSFCGIARKQTDGEILGLYILHPNNVGRCGHICNASYAVAKNSRGLGIGAKLVAHSLAQGRECGFRILQFNAVCASNRRAQELYARLGFSQLGTVPGGFRRKDGSYEDICLYYHCL